MNRNRRRKALQGKRSFNLRLLPWKTILLISLPLALLIAALTVTFSITTKIKLFRDQADYYADQSAKSMMNNLVLNEQVTILESELYNEKDSFETFIQEAFTEKEELRLNLLSLEEDFDLTLEENTALLDQLSAAKLQNDTLKRKLDTILGTASRNGAELTPSPMGPSGLTLAELKILTKGTGLVGIEQALLDIEEIYNVNALYALAVAKLETGSGTSFLAKPEYNNLYAMRTNDWFRYETRYDSVMAFGKLMVNNYFGKGFDTIEKIGPRYAEGSQTWAIKAKYHMLNDLRKLH